MSISKWVAWALVSAFMSTPLAARPGTLTTLYTFSGGAGGGNPRGTLIYHGDAVYGTTPSGGSGNGEVFKVNANTGAFKVVYAFKGGDDGAAPYYGVIYHQGAFFGTTEGGGSPIGTCTISFPHGCGTIFSINAKTLAETVLFSFGSVPNPVQALPGPLLYLAGTLYGTTSNGGVNGYGSVFSTNPATNAFATLYSFAGGNDGAVPGAQLLNENGLFYGTTAFGGGGPCTYVDDGCGTVFAINPATGTETIVHAFLSFKGGFYPFSNLIYQAGSLVGDTSQGGMKPPCRNGCGVNFAINPSTGAETILDTYTNRKALYSAVTLHGQIAYETLGSAGGHGELVEVHLDSGKKRVLYKFTGGADGGYPEAPLTFHDGAFYGSTVSGGTVGGCVGDGGCGTIFKFVP